LVFFIVSISPPDSPADADFIDSCPLLPRQMQQNSITFCRIFSSLILYPTSSIRIIRMFFQIVRINLYY